MFHFQVQIDYTHMSATYNLTSNLCITGIDVLSKVAYAKCVTSENTSTAIAFIEYLMKEMKVDKIEEIWMDNGSSFGDDTKEFCEDNGIRVVNSLANHPTGHGGIERFHRTVKGLLKTSDKKNVDEGPNKHLLARVVYQYNNK